MKEIELHATIPLSQTVGEWSIGLAPLQAACAVYPRPDGIGAMRKQYKVK
jgi:hypothetical protein